MTRRGFLAAVIPIAGTIQPASGRAVVHVSGRLMTDTSDLQDGYYVLCGTGTGQCQATNAIGISVHPENKHHSPLLAALVGKDVQLSIFVP